MRTSKFLTCLFFSLMFSTLAMGQGKVADDAADAYKKGFYFNAIELYKKAYTMEKKASEKARLIFMVGECYRALGDPAQQEVWYEKANRAQYADPVTYLYIGDALKEQGKYAEAIAAYNKYKEKKPNDMRADAGISASQVAQQWLDSPSRYSVDPEVLLNTPFYDFTPAFSDKKNEDVVFTSTRPGATGTNTDMIVGESFSDLFASSRDRLGKWSEPVKLPPAVNTDGNEGAPIFDSKRKVMYFTRCPSEKKKVFGCDIWMAKKVGSNYSEPVMLKLKPESKCDSCAYSAAHPALSADDSRLVFMCNDPGLAGARGGRDLYWVQLDKDGMPLGKPTNLGNEVNTPKDEMFPFLRNDGSLYFASNGHSGMGGLDIFMASSTGQDQWGGVENMKSPINSSMDDFGLMFDGDEDRGFFTSNRPGGKGQDDIWRFYVQELVFGYQGTVYDKVSGNPIPGVNLNVVGTDGSNVNGLTDDNGGFSFVENGKDRYIKENTTYSILVSKDGYLVAKDQITTVGLNESTTFVKEYFLQPANESVIIKLPEVQYEFDKFALTQNGKDSLEVLYQTLIDNPTIIIELRAHTDSRGSDPYNLTLSQNRAKSCVNYLVSKGIDPVRMEPKGLGETELRISDAEIKKMATEEEREAAHQQNRRTEFKVLSFDYVPKDNMTPEN